MRRAWLLALTVAPAIAAAQVVPVEGQITFDNEFINSTECSGTGDILLSWEVQLVTSVVGTTFPTDGSMKVFATNQDFSGNECPIAGTPTGREVGQVGATIEDPSTPDRLRQRYQAKLFVDAAKVGCTEEADIWVCVQFYNGAGTKAGFAKGERTLKIRLGKPLALENLSATPGDSALEVRWTDPASPNTAKYRVHVLSLTDPAAVTSVSRPEDVEAMSRDPQDPDPHVVGFIATEGERVEDLVNDVVYAVWAYSFDEAENQSDPSFIVTAPAKAVDDFWERYKAWGGQEQGGCAGGPAGLASLAIAAALAAVLRRRK